MKIPKEPVLVRRMIDSRVKQLAARGPVLAASLVRIEKRCGRPGCHCETGERHVGHYVTRPVKGRTKTVYVPLDLVEEVRSWIEEHKRLKVLVREITQLTSTVIAGHVQDKKRKAGRR